MAPTLTLNGTAVPTVFVGLTPTAVGLYQIDFQMPANIPGGNLPLFVTQDGVNSNTVIMFPCNNGKARAGLFRRFPASRPDDVFRAAWRPV